MTEVLEGQIGLFGPDTQFGKTCQDPCLRESRKAQISKRSSPNSSASSAKKPPLVPIPANGWPNSGCISGMGDSLVPFSIAWRLHDAQYWGPSMYVDGRMWLRGTPQRRKRISLVADFAGLSAGEILFERKGLRGYFETGEYPWEGIAE